MPTSTTIQATQTAILVALGVVVVTGVIGSVVTPANSVQIFGFCSIVSVSLLSLLQQQNASAKADENAVKVDELTKVSKDTHTLVNSNMGVQLKLNAELSEWKAKQTGLPDDRVAAELAKKMYAEHLEKQKIVDTAKGVK